MTDHLRTPLEIVQGMDYCLTFIKKGTKVVNDARLAHLEAKHTYLKAYKESRLKSIGNTVADREDEAWVANSELHKAMEIAEAAYQHAREKRNDLSDELSKLQTEGALVRAELGLSR